MVGSEQGLKGKEGGKRREKGWEERAPKAHSKNSDFGTPMLQVLFDGLPNKTSVHRGECRHQIRQTADDLKWSCL